VPVEEYAERCPVADPETEYPDRESGNPEQRERTPAFDDRQEVPDQRQSVPDRMAGVSLIDVVTHLRSHLLDGVPRETAWLSMSVLALIRSLIASSSANDAIASREYARNPL